MSDESNGRSPQTGATLSSHIATLAEGILRWTGGANRFDSPVSSMHFSNWDHPTDPTSYSMGPSVCIIAQGAKRVVVGEESYDYDAQHYLVTSVDLPVVAQILEASPERPYLGVILGLDQQALAQLMVNPNLAGIAPRSTDRGIGVSRLSFPLVETINRLVGLLDAPESIPILAPLIKQELHYHLLVGPQGPRLRQMVISGTHGHQIAKAIDWLRANYSETVPIDDLADLAHMSRSAFYQHFRSITSLSPLQYRKHLRLQEARRRMVVDQVDATTAALKVGYESPSQFNREYRRLFGKPPVSDAARLREGARTS